MLRTIIQPNLCFSIRLAIRSSSSKTPTVASMISKAISASANISSVRPKAYFSIPKILPRLRIPAVSTKVILWSWYSKDSSTGSMVVPATGETTTRSSFKKALSRELLPVLTRPIMATFMSLSSSSTSSI